jgi:apolipoprotein N-acyltransferase
MAKRNNIWNAFIFAGLFIVGEWLQSLFYPLAFPWGRIGAIVAPATTFIQSASLFGSLFTSFLVISINGLLALTIKTKSFKPLLIAFAVLFGNLTFGMIVQKPAYKLTTTKNVLMIQGNTPQLEKWELSHENLTGLYINSARKNITPEIDIILIPETALPFDLLNSPFINEFKTFAEQNNVSVIAGFVYNDEYNSMIAINPDSYSEVYSKQRLVPMGEMLPFGTFLADTAFADFEPFQEGTGSVLIEATNVKYGATICYESIFPEVSREHVAGGAEVIIIPSNDSWFGRFSALSQHHNHAILRAVENGRYVLRASNNAVTSVITPYGEVKATAPRYELATLQASFEPLQSRTLYSYIGDSFVFLPIALCIWELIKLLKTSINKRQSPKTLKRVL